MSRHDATRAHGGVWHKRRRSMALVVAVKVVIVVLVLALPSGIALSLGAAHGVALLLVAVLGAGLLTIRIVKGRSRECVFWMTNPGGQHMLTAEAHIQTANASRYLVQLCEHATKFSHRLQHLHGKHERPEVLGVDWSDTHGTLNLSWGQCTLDADPTALTVRVKATTEEKLRQVQDIVTADLERFGQRDQLAVTWKLVQADEVG